MSDRECEHIRFESSDATGSIIIDRAERRNAITLAMWQAIPRLLEQAARETGLKMLMLRAADGGTFSAGADIGEMTANIGDKTWIAANQTAINNAQFQLARFALPTMAFVEGDCIGGGCGLALACDMRVATPNARFGITPAKLGIVYPFHDIKLLIDLVGPAQAKRLLFSGDFIDAVEAREVGLVEMIASTPDALERSICSASSASNRRMKEMVRLILDGQVAESAATAKMFADAFESRDFAEGTAAFVGKRKPDFA